ncbi:flavin monoamine oxidase family protein [Salinarimonas rosea]|uniref:flavin monoamine oxidase family protein n=1 Tax=Salinarimonas rosea TaxID=552063 RepID=UPI000426CE8D|nr:FAD-dependent oxidoreductase [Salinarimonas rosea]
MRQGFEKSVPYVRNVSANPWLPDFPNPPDLRFNYFKLLNDSWATGQPIGRAPTAKTVAVVGAGAAGMTVARELWRSGYQVRIFEATSRLGGRLYTERKSFGTTAYELGAMRMPFFNDVKGGEAPGNSTNCLLAYFLNQDQRWSGNPNPTFANLSDFPNPGQTKGGTGIYMNNGLGPNDVYDQPTMIPWPDGGQPENPDLQEVARKVDALIDLFTAIVAPVYAQDGPEWDTLWQQIANNYDKMSFSDLVFTEAITPAQYAGDGWFGGFGMTPYESDLFYTIGSGDGSWGAFYSISAMWFIRCVMFGYSSDLQTVSGLNNAFALPMYNATPFDTNGAPLEAPFYRGIQSLVEMLFYLRAPGTSRSLYAAARNGNDTSAAFFVNTPVSALKRNTDGTISVHVNARTAPALVADYVVITSPIWATQLSIDFEGFDTTTMLPWQVPEALHQQHLIASAKVFYPLYKAYWNEGSKIPQLIVTDTFVQDAYSVQWSTDNNDAAILASYTWEDDALKVLADTNDTILGGKVLAELDRITQSTLGESILKWVDTRQTPTVIHWLLQPTYRGCAKLYRQRGWEQCYDLLTYNQTYSYASNLYFAGESYGVEGGWTEPALRTALDAVIHLVNNSGGVFNNGFTFNDYPGYDTTFQPSQTYPQTSGAAAPPAAE